MFSNFFICSFISSNFSSGFVSVTTVSSTFCFVSTDNIPSIFCFSSSSFFSESSIFSILLSSILLLFSSAILFSFSSSWFNCSDSFFCSFSCTSTSIFGLFSICFWRFSFIFFNCSNMSAVLTGPPCPILIFEVFSPCSTCPTFVLILLSSSLYCSIFLVSFFLKSNNPFEGSFFACSDLSELFSVSATNSLFSKVFFIAWYIDWNILFSSSNLTSNFAGCTLTSTFEGFILIFNTTNPYFPIGIKPLYACSVAAVNILSFIYLLFTKNNWFDLFDLAISGFPITPVISISSYV